MTLVILIFNLCTEDNSQLLVVIGMVTSVIQLFIVGPDNANKTINYKNVIVQHTLFPNLGIK